MCVLGLSCERESEIYQSSFAPDKPRRPPDKLRRPHFYVPAGHHYHTPTINMPVLSSSMHVIMFSSIILHHYFYQTLALLIVSCFIWPEINTAHYGAIYAAMYTLVVARKPPDKMYRYFEHITNNITLRIPTVSSNVLNIFGGDLTTVWHNMSKLSTSHGKRRMMRGRFHTILFLLLSLPTIANLLHRWSIGTLLSTPVTWNSSSSSTPMRDVDFSAMLGQDTDECLHDTECVHACSIQGPLRTTRLLRP